MKVFIPTRIHISKEFFACVGLFFYLSKSVVRTVLAQFLHTPEIFNTWVSIALMYIPLLFIPFLKGSQRKVFDFFLLWLFLFLSCIVTSIFHPTYDDWLFDGEFNIWRSIFYPDQAIYIYLFIRLIDDPEKIFKTLRNVAFLLLAYNLYKFVYAVYIRGYWEATGVVTSGEAEYNLGFGYDVLFLFVIFMVLGRRDSKWYYFLAGIALFCIIVAGSRGPLLGVGLMFIFQLWDRVREKAFAQRVLIIGIAITAIVVIIVNFSTIMMGMAYFFQNIGVSSRTLMKIVGGEIFDDSGRERLYQIAMDLIRDGGPFGNGIYADRVAISSMTTMWIGYCHQVVLEILVDYGYLLGGVFLVLMLQRMIKILFSANSEWRSLYLIFLISSSQLLLSGSYLYSFVFWGCLAIAICWSEEYGRGFYHLFSRRTL